MKRKYRGIFGSAAVAAVLGLIATLTACEDDFGKDVRQSGFIALNVVAPTDWTDGVVTDNYGPESRCTSVDAVSVDGETPLYLHTIESDQDVQPVSARGALKSAVKYFSLSAICYPGSYPENEDDVDWTPNFAYDLKFTVNGSAATGEQALMWPQGGKVRFFAFALPDGETAERPFDLSAESDKGSPKITYTVPADVKTQHDLLAACTDADGADVKLEFNHILTAVKIVAADDMIPGTIKSVTIEGVNSEGTYIPRPAAGGAWTGQSGSATFTVENKVELSGSYKPDSGSDDDKIIGDMPDKPEIVGETGDLTFLMMPQTLPDNAKITIVFTEKLSGADMTISGSLKGKVWQPGKVVTYAVSPSSVNIKPVVEFNKTEADVLPYSGVWSDVKLRAYAEVSDASGGKYYVELPRPTLHYKFDDATEGDAGFYDSDGNDFTETQLSKASSKTYADLADISFIEGMAVLSQQGDFKTLQNKFEDKDKNDFAGTKDNPFNLYSGYGITESANCYMVGKPGYYKFPVVYGNSCSGGLTGGNKDAYTIEQLDEDGLPVEGMMFYVDYKDDKIDGNNYKPSEELKDAQLAWQDSPGLIDDVKLLDEGDDNYNEDGVRWIRFRVRKHTINQGNALIVVRKGTGQDDIVWSWHIWVSQHTQKWMSRQESECCAPLTPIYGDITAAHKLPQSQYDYDSYDFHFTKFGRKYYLTKYNLGYCDPHTGNPERKFNISFKVTVGGKEITLTKSTEFTQAEFKGSLAGDNPYYQWGRKDPMLAGIYNSSTPVYCFGTAPAEGKDDERDYSELNMENKPTFDVFKGDDFDYDFTRNGYSESDTKFEEEKGVDIKWTIINPYKFVMSKYDNKLNNNKDYREHWHKFIDNTYQPVYAKTSNSKLFQMWNPKLKSTTDDTKQATNHDKNWLDGVMPDEDNEMCKSVYDPCPAGYCVPPAVAFTALAYYGAYQLHACYNHPIEKTDGTKTTYETSIKWDESNRTWTVSYPGGTIDFPATGVRNKSPRFATFASIVASTRSRAAFKDPSNLKGTTLPAFRSLMYVAGSSMGQKNDQVDVFYIDNRSWKSAGYAQDKTYKSLNTKPSGSIESAIGSLRPSADSYGLNIRPALMVDKK